MSDNNIIGAEIGEQQRELLWRRDTGYSQVFRNRGLKVWIYAQLPYWQITADEVRITEESGPYATITALVNTVLDGRVEEPINVWEIIGQTANPGLYQHPKVPYIQEDYSQDGTWFEGLGQLDILRSAVQTKLAGHAPEIFPTDANAKEMYRLLTRGTDNFQRTQYVLRKTQSVTNQFALDMNMMGVDCIWTLDQIYEVETIWDKTANTVGKIQAPKRIKPSHAWGWLKQGPQLAQEANNKIKVTQEWWLSEWSTWSYPVYPQTWENWDQLPT